MSVELSISTELLDAIGEDQLAHSLRMFDATIVSSRSDDHGFSVVYALDVPDAPQGAARVEPTYGIRGRTPYLMNLNWYDVAGRLIHPQAAEPTIPADPQ